MSRGIRILVAALSVACAVPAAAQQGDPLARAVRAYDALDYRTAAAVLAASLRAGPVGLAPPDRARALCYLGAIDVLDGDADSALVVYRSLVREYPGFRPDTVVFPPRVTAFFERVRWTTPALAAEVPPLSRMGLGHDSLALQVVTSVPAAVTASVLGRDGGLVRHLFSGQVADSLAIGWDGTQDGGVPVPAGHYVLAVTASGDGRGLRIPLELTRTAPDTLPLPRAPDSLLPERDSPSPARSLAVGLTTGAAAFALPALVAPRATVTGARLTVGVAIAASVLLELLHVAPGHAIRHNVLANERVQADWRHRADSVRTINAARRAQATWTVRAGRPVALGPLSGQGSR